MGLLDNMFDLTGKTAVITGAGSGIGEATCLVLAEAGAAVVAADINEARAKATADQVVQQGGKAVAIRTDVQSRADHDAAAEPRDHGVRQRRHLLQHRRHPVRRARQRDLRARPRPHDRHQPQGCAVRIAGRDARHEGAGRRRTS